MKINKMPDKKTLEDYLDGSNGEVKVMFDIEKGEFHYIKHDQTNNNVWNG